VPLQLPNLRGAGMNGAMFLAVAAACMARGLTPGQADLVWALLQTQAVPNRVSETMRMLEEAILKIR
jgi:hypothetical protein